MFDYAKWIALQEEGLNFFKRSGQAPEFSNPFMHSKDDPFTGFYRQWNELLQAKPQQTPQTDLLQWIKAFTDCGREWSTTKPFTSQFADSELQIKEYLNQFQQQANQYLTGFWLSAHQIGDQIPGDWQQKLENFKLAGVGDTDQIKRVADLSMQYQQNSLAILKIFQEIGSRSTTATMEKVANAPEITSLRQLYDIWADCYEAAYQEAVFTDHYRKVHGRLTNAVLGLRKIQQTQLNKWFKEMNLPAADEFTATVRQLHETRQRLKRAEKAITELQSSLAVLRAEKTRVKTTKRPANPRKKTDAGSKATGKT